MSALCDKHAELKNRIQAIFDAHKGRYGYRRVTAAIRQLGQAVNHKTVQHLMVKMGLKSLVRPKKYRSYKGSVGRTAPDLIKRQFTAQAINQKWVTDVTEFNVAGEKLLCVNICRDRYMRIGEIWIRQAVIATLCN